MPQSVCMTCLVGTEMEPFEDKGVPLHTIKGYKGAKEEVPTQQSHVYALSAVLLGNMFWYK